MPTLQDLENSIENLKTWNAKVAAGESGPNENNLVGALTLMLVNDIKKYGEEQAAAVAESGAIPLSWIGPTLLECVEGYLRTCKSGGMKKSDADTVMAHVENMLQLKYLDVALASKRLGN